MLPDLTVPASLPAVLENLRVFTTPTFATFTALVTGLVAQTGKGTVTGMLTGAGLARTWSHDRAHWVLLPVAVERRDPEDRAGAPERCCPRARR